MPTRISPQTEANILAAIDTAMTDVDSGAHPNEAISKAAAAGDFTPGHVRLMAQAYNTGRTNAQRKSASDVLEKAAVFPVADAEVILEKLYPKHVKTAAALEREAAVSVDYGRPPAFRPRPGESFFEPEAEILTEKRANVAPALCERPAPLPAADQMHRTKLAWSLLRETQREADEKRRLVSAARDKVAGCLSQLDDYFRTSGSVDFKQARKTAAAALGRRAEAVLDKVAEANPKLLKGPEVKLAGCFAASQEPYRTVRACLAAVIEHGQRSQEFADFEKAAALPTRELVDHFIKTPYDGLIFSSVMRKEDLIKIAGPGDLFKDSFRNATTMSLTRSIMGHMPGSGDADDDAGREQALTEITDPVHEQRLRAIQAKAMLHDFMANDDVIKSHDPVQVTDLFNQVSQLAPRAAQEPMLMRALIRRHLEQGRTDPHEIDQLGGIEDKLRSRDQPMAVPELGPAASIKRMLGTDKPKVKNDKPVVGPAGPPGPRGKTGKPAVP